MSSDSPVNLDSKAQVDFECMQPECKGIVNFNLIDVADENFNALCGECHSSYEFDDELRTKLNKLRNLIIAIRESEDILGDCNVSVTVPAGNVKIPYALLLTRLNTMIKLNVGGKEVDFHFRIEPASPDTFR
jgi:hypothetical protein